MTASRRVSISEFGPPEVMSVIADDLAAPASNEAQVRHTAIGFNYLDIYQRRGDMPLPLPTGLGLEAAGIVEAIGPGVGGLKAGDRVVTMNAGLGAYSERRNVPADKLVKLPDGVSDEVAATVFFKGIDRAISDPRHPQGEGWRPPAPPFCGRRSRADSSALGRGGGRRRHRRNRIAA